MAFLVVGINHKIAPLDIREQLALESATIPSLLTELSSTHAPKDLVLLSTCNRTEIYAHQETSEAQLIEWLFSRCPQENQKVYKTLAYHHRGEAALSHLVRVAAGLDSMILGEPEILGQIKKAYQLAHHSGTIGRDFRYWFPAVFSIAKRIRQQTSIGAHPISYAYVAIQMAKRIFDDLSQCSVLLIGAGEMMTLAATHLKGAGIKDFWIVNRTPEKAQFLADYVQGNIIPVESIETGFQRADIVLIATGCPHYWIDKPLISRSLQQRKRRPLCMIDLGVPRDIDPVVGDLPDIYLYDLDRLQEVITQNQANREEALKQAEAIVQIAVAHYVKQWQVLNSGNTITRFRQQWEAVRDAELAKAKAQLQHHQDPEMALEDLARRLTNKFLHTPTTRIRKAAYDGQQDALLMMKDLLEF